ncbi:MAG TPA: glycosyl hydrolase [Ancylobacter sp.]
MLRGSALAALLCAAQIAPAMAAEVTVSGETILVDGAPFKVRGAAGDGPLQELENLGATTVRTYGGDPGATLDAAQAAGLKVIVGLWVEHPRRGVDYTDRAFVERQKAEFREIVERYKDHPAPLMWGIGNEVESELADDSAVWPAIEEIASMVKRLDPEHPTLAVIAETGADKVAKLIKHAPSIDVLGVNSYGDALYSVVERARDQGWTGPVVITELGALGQWQAATTPWGAPFEITSTQKAIQLRRYLKALGSSNAGVILFLWGHKQEVTATWHSLRLPSGEWIEASESMAEAWGGRTPGDNHAPRIAQLRFADDESAPYASWKLGQQGAVLLEANDPDGDPLDATWEIRSESTDRRVAGDLEAAPPSHPEAVREGSLRGAGIAGLPVGHYRIFVEIRDGKGAAASGNLPFEIR